MKINTQTGITKEIKELQKLPAFELIQLAYQVRMENFGPTLEMCGIINAKSGRCAEDCRFCAQSVHHQTDCREYPLVDADKIVAAAHRAAGDGAGRFGIVTSGGRLSKKDIASLTMAAAEISSTGGPHVCASLGMLDADDFRRLREAGLKRFHHNIETAPGYFKQITTTHTFEDRIRTIRLAREAGFEVCSGVIIGMGESEDDRVQAAGILNELDVDAIPLNILTPIAGTSLAAEPPLAVKDILRAIAMFRLINPKRVIKIAAGREAHLADFMGLAFSAGANGMMIGGYLTIAGRPPSRDLAFVKEMTALWTDKTDGYAT